MRRPLVAQKVEPPAALVQQMGAALLIECWRIGNTAAVLSRENVADASDSPNYRWHLSVAHPERKPTPQELELALEKLPSGIAFCTEVTELVIDPEYNQIDVWEIEDLPLARHWHFGRS